MLIRIDNLKIYIIEQKIRSNIYDNVRYDIVESVAHPEICRYRNRVIDTIFIQGIDEYKNNIPLEAYSAEECGFIINKLKSFCKHFNEPFSILEGRINLK